MIDLYVLHGYGVIPNMLYKCWYAYDEDADVQYNFQNHNQIVAI